MSGEDNKNVTREEYRKFKKEEPEYIKKKVDEMSPKNRKSKKDWMIWSGVIVVVSVLVFGTVNHMMESREEVSQEQVVNRLSAGEAVEQMFDSSGEWIRTDLTQKEFDVVSQKVDELDDSSRKVKISSQLNTAREQLESQLEAISLVNGLKTSGGVANVDLKTEDLLNDMEDFPSNYNPEYVEELKKEYQTLFEEIKKAESLQKRVRELAVDMDGYLDKTVLDSLDEQVKGLPDSDKRDQLVYDMKSLYQEYDKQQEELERIREEEERQRRKEEARRKEEEAVRRAEQERLEEARRREQEQIEREQEKERLRQEELERIEEFNNNQQEFEEEDTQSGSNQEEYDDKVNDSEEPEVEGQQGNQKEGNGSTGNNNQGEGSGEEDAVEE